MRQAFGSSSPARSETHSINMPFTPDKCKRILIVKLSSIGDVVMATPVAKALRTAFPDSHIAWVVESKSKDAVIGNPYVDEVIIWNRTPSAGTVLQKTWGVLSGLIKLRPILRSRKFDVAIDFQGLLRSALVTRVSGTRYRIGYDNGREGSTLFYNVRFPTRHRKVRGPQQYLKLLELLGIHTNDLDMHVPLGDDDRAFAGELISSAGPDADAPVVALCPATTWPQKHWTDEGWAQFADVIVSEHHALPVFLGSSADTESISHIRSLMKHNALDAAGKTTLKQASALIEKSSLTIGVDTGLLHISLALGRPTVGIFGPTRWQHLTSHGNLVVVSKRLACAPCMRHPTCKHFDCMREITAEDVLSAAKPWLIEKQPFTKPEQLTLVEEHTRLQLPRTLHVETGMHSLGGPAQVVYLMTGLKNRGYDTTIICPRGSSVSQHAAAAGLNVITLPLRTDLDISFVPRLYRIIKQVDPDIVHLHSRRGADIMGGIAARLAKVPAVVLSRRIDNPVRRGLLSYLKYGPLCDHIIAVSNGVAGALTKGGVEPDKITRVHSVTDAKRYQKKGSEDKIRSEFGLDEGTNIIAVIAQLIERKGHRFLLQAMPKILESFPKTVILVLGEGQLEGNLRELAASLGIQDKVIFAGFRNDIGELLSITTVLVHPATMEGFANCVLQAMAAKVPVVVSAVGGMPESVHDGVNGILIPPKDVDALADAVMRLLGDPDLRRRMGAAGRQIVEEQFSVDGMVNGVIDVYNKVLNSKPSAG